MKNSNAYKKRLDPAGGHNRTIERTATGIHGPDRQQPAHRVGRLWRHIDKPQTKQRFQEENQGDRQQQIRAHQTETGAEGQGAHILPRANGIGHGGLVGLCDRFGEGYPSSEKFSGGDAAKVAEEQCRAFLAGEFERLGILFTRYQSMMTQVATLTWVLPLEKTADVKTTPTIFEPDEQTVLDAAVPTYVSGVLAACVRESFASEVAARRMAMDSAGKNAQEMIDRLQLQYNRARQNSITQEITEIVAGSGL